MIERLDRSQIARPGAPLFLPCQVDEKPLSCWETIGEETSSMAVQAEMRLAWIGAQLDALYAWRARLETELSSSGSAGRERKDGLRARIAQADADIAYTWQRQRETERARRSAFLCSA